MSLVRCLAPAFALLVAAAAALPGSALAQEGGGGGASSTPIVLEMTGDDVNLRSGPSIDYHDVGKAARGDLLVYAGEDAEWTRVTIPGGPVVHVFAPLVDWDEGVLRGTVRSDDVLMRATPAQAHLPVRDQKLRKGEELIVLGVEEGDDGRWLRVVAPERIHVWVHSRYVRRIGFELAWDRLPALRNARLDALTDGRTKAEREARQIAEREDWVGKIEALEAALAAGRAGENEKSLAEQLSVGVPDPALRERARRVRDGIVADVRRRQQAAAAAEADRVRREIDEMAREQARSEERYRRQMEAQDDARKRASRGEPLDTGTVARRDTGFVLLRGTAVIRELASRRLRMRDYVGKRVRVWGTHSAQEGDVDRVDVTSLEILPDSE